MNRAKIIAAHLLEADPDDIDPKRELLKINPDIEHWLEMNGFELSLDMQWFVKKVGDRYISVRPPMRMAPTFTVYGGGGSEPHFDLSEDEMKNLLIRLGAAK